MLVLQGGGEVEAPEHTLEREASAGGRMAGDTGYEGTDGEWTYVGVQVRPFRFFLTECIH